MFIHVLSRGWISSVASYNKEYYLYIEKWSWLVSTFDFSLNYKVRLLHINREGDIFHNWSEDSGGGVHIHELCYRYILERGWEIPTVHDNYSFYLFTQKSYFTISANDSNIESSVIAMNPGGTVGTWYCKDIGGVQFLL